ncbi:nicotinate-nucleotide adenylyltransferase [Faunimonas pinastri]|uniref:Probable nicotinate-nucleotide adenylyltransferase n=1 Tax=Faunimonas pinastri TaxID=1855383 RepID=A0A1H9MIZ9_9HYPH|nr:nicotinate-nucleotide adenylyltransferase [Faunimonas pinastri]SER23662.1 nicotinate-nucleotide adenylyltransferase [Faunimonas pinastri]
MTQPSRIEQGLPPFSPGQRIGLYGGSFNPAHAGHRQVSLLALHRLKLDRIWWLVTPGNPLKDTSHLPPLSERMRRAAEIAAHPQIVVTGLEAELGTRYTADLLATLTRRAQGVRFVWIMGSDNLRQLDRWDRWQTIAETVPIAVVNRPGSLNAALSSRAAQALWADRVPDFAAADLANRKPPAWTFITGPRTPLSSTALRVLQQKSEEATKDLP